MDGTTITTSPKSEAQVLGVPALSVADMYIISMDQEIIRASQHQKYKQTSTNIVNIIYYGYIN